MENLPTEVLHIICGHMNLFEINKFMKTSTKIYNDCTDYLDTKMNELLRTAMNTNLIIGYYEETERLYLSFNFGYNKKFLKVVNHNITEQLSWIKFKSNEKLFDYIKTILKTKEIECVIINDCNINKTWEIEKNSSFNSFNHFKLLIAAARPSKSFKFIQN